MFQNSTLLQLPEAVEATKKLGFETALALILTIAVLAFCGLLLRWLLKKFDEEKSERLKKDDVIANKDIAIMKVISDRRDDLTIMQQSLGATAEAVKEGAREIRQAFSDLASEIRKRN